MRYAALVLALLSLAGCASRTAYGPCIGINGEEDPSLVYKYSAWNIGVGIVFFEMILPPIVVAFDALKCPEAMKNPAPAKKGD